MRALAATDLVALWERSQGLHPIDRALDALRLALQDAEDLERLPLGQRDALLLNVRAATLGDSLVVRDSCPSCGAEVEIDLSCSTLVTRTRQDPGDDAIRDTWQLSADGYGLTLRRLDSLDAAAAARTGDLARAEQLLLERSVVAAERDGKSIAAAELPSEIVALIGASLAEHDPGVEYLLDVTCPECRRTWQPALDLASVISSELATRGARLIGDVHLLARAYGWSEREILSLSDARRNAFISLVVS